MKKALSIGLVTLLFSLQTSASFFDELVDLVEEEVKQTARVMVQAKAVEIIHDMIINYTSKQTKTEKEVVEEYKEEKGSLPENTIASSYKTEILPGSAVSPGTEVLIKSVIEVIPGKNASSTSIEERLTIFDNEDNNLILTSMTKKAGKRSGGEFYGEFTFTLPEGLPQGVYPIQSTLLLNGELAGDQSHNLQLVLWVDELHKAQLVASTFHLLEK